MIERMEMAANVMQRALKKYRSVLHMVFSELGLSFKLAWNRRKCCTAEYERGRSSVMNLRKGLSSKLSSSKMRHMMAGNVIETNGAMSRIVFQCCRFSVCCSVVCVMFIWAKERYDEMDFM
ncbi:hypothetical protein J0A71_08g16710 [Encephalitozoon cuniculi]|nr:hypothetical protein J0A71_08g16710 [Encephalitozoon cuniculi]